MYVCVCVCVYLNAMTKKINSFNTWSSTFNLSFNTRNNANVKLCVQSCIKGIFLLEEGLGLSK